MDKLYTRTGTENILYNNFKTCYTNL